jgi:hypothetical protein
MDSVLSTAQRPNLHCQYISSGESLLHFQYLGRLEKPTQSPNEVKFFKIDEYTKDMGTG